MCVFVLVLHIEVLESSGLKQCGMTVRTVKDPAVQSDTLSCQQTINIHESALVQPITHRELL